MRNNSKCLKSGFHNRNKRSNRPNRDDVAEEPSKTQVKEKSVVPKKEKKEKVSANQHSEEEPSVQGKKKGGKEKEKEKVTVTVPPNVEKIVDEYIASHSDARKIHADYIHMKDTVVVGDKQHLKCCQHADRNRHADVPCLDETRVVLEGEKDACDYIHANKVFFNERQFIVAQAPKQNTHEDFWRMIFQSQCAAIVVLCPFYEQGHESSESFWPMNINDYKYYGKMFINNKKVDHTTCGAVFTIEVLPDGCSNSLLTKIHHFTTWENENVNMHNSRAILRLMRAVKTTETGVTAIVSSTGVGRACAYVLIDIVTLRLFNGTPTKLVDVAAEIRKKRALAFRNEESYLSAAFIILDYVRAKLPKHGNAVKEFSDGLNNLDP